MTRIVALSDTHGHHRRVQMPEGDILIFAGDFTKNYDEGLKDFNNWLGTLDFEHILVTPGNFDISLDPVWNKDALEKQSLITNGKLLIDQSITIDGIKFYLSPSCRRYGSPAFSLDSAEKAKEIWDKIPKDVDVLVTHGPARGILDLAYDTGDKAQGCPVLRDWIDTFKPPVHLHGHIHESYGVHRGKDTLSINASFVTYAGLRTELINSPTVITIGN